MADLHAMRQEMITQLESRRLPDGSFETTTVIVENGVEIERNVTQSEGFW